MTIETYKLSHFHSAANDNNAGLMSGVLRLR